jgi:predicted acylesterase/phospholipase RssA
VSDPNTMRILEFDGGGERGYMSLTFFNRFVQQWGIDPTTISQKFDVICGTSVGGIMALALAIGKTPDELLSFFTEQGPYLFTLGSNVFPPIVIPPIVPSIRPNAIEKVALIITNIPFYNSSGTYANAYGSGLLRTLLETLFGDKTMQDVKANVIIPTFEYTTKTFVLCSNLDNPAFSAQDELISNVALATSAAPVYLPPIELTSPINTKLNGVFFDGGIYQNNPSQFGYALGKMTKPTANRACILSLGTGAGEYGFDNDPESFNSSINDPILLNKTVLEKDKKKYSSNTTLRMVLQKMGHSVQNLNKLQNKMLDLQVGDIDFNTIKFLFELFSIASTGAQDSVSQSLYLESTYTLDQLYNYRFNPKLDLTLDPALDNTSPEILTYYEDLANQTYNDDIENISTFLGHLTV